MPMETIDKKTFAESLQNFNKISTDDASRLCALREEFPYSQVLQVLAARLSKEHQLSSEKQDLQLAAVYSADRSVLKEVMLKNFDVWPSSNELTGQIHSETPKSIALDNASPENTKAVEGDLADKVMQDLRKLNISRSNFENMMDDHPQSEIEVPDETKEEVPLEKKKKRKLPPGRKRGNLKAHRIVELAKSLENELDSNGSPQEEDKKIEDIVESIKVSKKKITPESDAQLEQIKIIDHFIKVQPSISPARKMTTLGQEDLNTIKSGEFGDNVISETLVDILLQQGKKDKAIEVLKKLIWKYPQKKSYFAAQIEDLKK